MDDGATGQDIVDILDPKLSDEDLERAAAGGAALLFPTFTCGPPHCATGGGCGTWSGVGPNSC
jgi:hypothetical protein